MPIDVSCPKCGSGLPVPEEFAGRTVRCGGCQELIPVPGLTPPPLPGAEEHPPPLTPARPVAVPVARAMPVRAEPVVEEPRPEPEKSVVTPARPSRVEHEPERARPQTKTAMLVIAGLMLFGCCGFGVLGYAFVQLTKKVADARRDRFTTVQTAPERPTPPVTPVTRPIPATRPTRETPIPNTPPTRTTPPTRQTPPTRTSPPTRPAPKSDLPVAPSPQGMKGLSQYVSFNADPIREDTTRTALTSAAPAIFRDGPNRKAARFMAVTDRDGETPKFVCPLSGPASGLTFREKEPFTIALWVRGGGQDAVPFAATQAVRDKGTRLLMRADARGLRIDLFCDPANPKASYSRSVTRSLRDMISSYHHMALTRGPDGTLKAFVDGTEMTEHAPESLPAKQPGELSFRHAGFGLRSEFVPYSFDIDEFCVFDRTLSADELNTLAGKGAK